MSESAASRARVVVVDDTRLDREMACEALRPHAEVEGCADAEEALAALRRRPADLVLSDLAMPGLSGLELLERVRREHPGTDFILLTAHASVESAVQALRMGAADYLRKPVDPKELALVVERTLDRRRLLRENHRLRDMLSTVEACRALAPCLEPGEIYPVALDILLGAVGAGRGLAVFRRRPTLASDGLALRGFGEGEARALRTAIQAGKGLALEQLERIHVASGGPLQEWLRAAGLEPAGEALVVPIRGDAGEGGVLAAFAAGRSFSESELERARLVAGHGEVALRNAERYHQAKERAFVDDVTGIYNARYLFTALEHELHRAERYESPLSVLFLDLDRFKLVNDRYGHLVGSWTLRRLAEVLGQCIRQVDTLARYGGDEFTILLGDTRLEAALQIAERIRATVQRAVFEARDDVRFGITVSIGVASYPDHGRTPEELLDLSDKAMYRAKSLGRNRVCSAGELGR